MQEHQINNNHIDENVVNLNSNKKKIGEEIVDNNSITLLSGLNSSVQKKGKKRKREDCQDSRKIKLLEEEQVI